MTLPLPRLAVTIAGVLAFVLLGAMHSDTARADVAGQLYGGEIAISPDGSRVYAGGSTGYVVLSRATDGTLSYTSAAPTFPGTGGGGPIVASPDGQQVYDAVISANALRMMNVTADSVTLGAQWANYTNGISGLTLALPGALSLTPDAHCAYIIASYDYPMSILSLRREAAGGALSYAGKWTAPDNVYLSGLTASPDSHDLYTIISGGNVGRLSIDGSTCVITRQEDTATSLSGNVRSIAMAPDGTSVYVGDASGKKLHVFARDSATGGLTFVQTLEQGVDGVGGLDWINDITVSPDGKSVYTTALVENALSVFARSDDGTLTQTDVIRDGVNGVTGLTKAYKVVVSPDGASVYATSTHEPQIAIFSRTASGALTFRGKIGQQSYSPPGGGGGAGSGGEPGGAVPPPGTTIPDGTGTTPPTPPAGPVGMSIDNGAQYTNDAQVELDIVWPMGASTVSLANDGGFRRAQTFPVKAKMAWRLDASGPERLPKTAYARFGNSSQTFTDDIILDQTAPTISAAALTRLGGRAHAAAKAKAKSYKVKVTASDKTSGVSRAQFAVKKQKPAKTVAYKKQLTYRGTAAPKYVRVQDRAGNFSKWRALRG